MQFSLYSLKTVLFSVSVQKAKIKIYHKILRFRYGKCDLMGIFLNIKFILLVICVYFYVVVKSDTA